MKAQSHQDNSGYAKDSVYKTDQLQGRVTTDGTDDVNAPLLIVTKTSVFNIRFVL